jgi:hypothetical protein
LAANIRVDKDGFVLKINPLDCPRIGGDFDGDAIAIYPLFTKEAISEAKEKMHPQHTKSMWVNPASVNRCPYSIELDAASTIYTITKN